MPVAPFIPRVVKRHTSRLVPMRPSKHRDPDPVYVMVKNNPVKETRELVPGVVMADFDADGNLVGVEVLR